MNIKNGVLMGVAFVAGFTVIGGSYAYMGNGVMNEDVKTAIVANDYASFVESAPEKLLEKVNSEEAFGEFVAHHEAKDKIQADAEAQVLGAVQSNDFTAFQKVQTDTKAKMKEFHDSLELVEGKEGHSQRVRPEPTAEQTAKMEEKQLERFEEIVSYYEENGTLPEKAMKRGHGKKGMGKGMRRGGDCENGGGEVTVS